ncbi:hypothetical protein, partial [Anaerosporobacter sp.]|uniref:hypothetical protein n=1 Tax=Anaerosporobacter sp. TaxID=1872529 RepID=UPI00286FA1B0
MEKTKILDNIVQPQGYAGYPLVNCFASLLLSQNKRIKPTPENLSNHREALYRFLLTASGYAFSCLYTSEYIPCSKIDFQLAIKNDEHIPYMMNFGKCNYHILQKEVNSEDEVKEQILESINREIPVLFEFTDSMWGIITGYENNGDTLYGFHGCLNKSDFKPDGMLENKMFFKANWSDDLKRVIIVDDFKAKPYEYSKYVNHWINVMENSSEGPYAYGVKAMEQYVELLSDNDFFTNIEEETLKETFYYLHCQSYLAETRIFMGMAFSGTVGKCALRNHLGIMKDVNADIKNYTDRIKNIGFKMHKLCWSYWEAIGEKKGWYPKPDEFATKLTDSKSRKKVLKKMLELKECDV